jgi:hypothetical protein
MSKNPVDHHSHKDDENPKQEQQIMQMMAFHNFSTRQNAKYRQHYYYS